MNSLVVRGGTVLTPHGWAIADVLAENGRFVSGPFVVHIGGETVDGPDGRPGGRTGGAGAERVAVARSVEGEAAAAARDTTLAAAGSPGHGPSSTSTSAVPPGAADAVIEAAGLRVVPGFVDLQCNGGWGIDLATEPERLWELASLLPRTGVTAWLPTIVTGPPDVRARALATLRAGPPPALADVPLAAPLGLHLEGPFLAPDRRGAHPPAWLRPPAAAAHPGFPAPSGVRAVPGEFGDPAAPSDLGDAAERAGLGDVAAPAGPGDLGRPAVPGHLAVPGDVAVPAGPVDLGRPAVPVDFGDPAAPSDLGDAAEPAGPGDLAVPAASGDLGRPAVPSDLGRPAVPGDLGDADLRDEVAGWSAAAGVRLVTLAPELPGALDLVRALVDRGVVVSAGHSAATAAEAEAGVDAGIRYVTHLFNAMPPLHHREPGLPGVALTDDRVTVGVIADGLHVAPRVVRLAARSLGPRLSLVTDAVAALGLAPGDARLGDQRVVSGDDGVRLPDGTLAGSRLAMDEAVRNAQALAGVDLARAVRAVTASPAGLLGLPDRGVIARGALADLVLLDDRGGVVATVVAGRLAYVRDAGLVREPAGAPAAEDVRGDAGGDAAAGTR